ncbi:18990_t:CDS:2 [Funneliformis geosporum]|nr:18990_t:CDS:2 [Funneliformis geosporum]
MVKWKREKVQDHKFDFVDVQEFEKDSFIGALLVTDRWAGGIKPKIPFVVSKWIVVGSICFSFLLLFIEVRKARLIVASRDISFAFTSIVAYRYYTLTSYAHWCFFQEIRSQQKGQDKIAFFVFFSFKGWKRLLFCDGPRQVINAMTLFTIFSEKGFTTNYSAYGSIFTRASMGVIIFTIRGNLKEYCCHLIDKRISELLKRQKHKRQNESKSTNNHFDGVAPTLPNIDDDNLAQNHKIYATPPSIQPHNDPPPMMFNNYNAKPPADPYILGRPNVQVPHYNPPPPQGVYTHHNNGSAVSLEKSGYNNPYTSRSGSIASPGIVPMYDQQSQPIGMEYPPSNNSNSAYSDQYSGGQGRHPYPASPPYQPQHQYPYQQMPPQNQGGYNDVDPNVAIYDDYHQYYEENAYDSYPMPPHSQQSPQNTHFVPIDTARQQTTNAIPPAQRNPYPPRSPHKTHFAPIETARQQTSNAIPPSQRNPHPPRTTHSPQSAHSNASSARYHQNPSSRHYQPQGGTRS